MNICRNQKKMTDFYRYHPLSGDSLAPDFDFNVSFVCVHQSIWWIQGFIIIIVITQNSGQLVKLDAKNQ